MTHVLCVRSEKNISNIFSSLYDNIDSSFIDRSICKNPNNKFLQLVPCGVFYNITLFQDKINFARYHYSTTNDEDYPFFKASIGLGDYVSQQADIKPYYTIPTEDGIEHFLIAKQDFIDILYMSIKRKFIKEFGEDIIYIINIPLIFDEDIVLLKHMPIKVEQGHIYYPIPIRLDNKDYEDFFKLAQNNKIKTDSITINIKDNVDIKEKYNIDDWSFNILNSIIQVSIIQDDFSTQFKFTKF